MQTFEYTTVDKSTWGAGPWQTEPDKMQFSDPINGLPCLIVRNGMGALCGYVGVPTSHPLFGKNYGKAENISVHGGLTFADACDPGSPEDHGICHIPGPGESNQVWWFGFDCAHHNDLIPAYPAMTPEFKKMMATNTYRNVAYVKAQIASLAQQLSEVK